MAKLRFFVVGYGNIGKRHVEEILKNPQTELAGICDNSAQRLAEAKVHQIPLLSCLSDLPKSNLQIDAVNICTPNGLHAAQAVFALENNYHVICEKPLALTVSDCHMIAKAEQNSGKKLICVMQNRFSPPSQFLKQTVSSGKLGRIFMVQLNLFWNRDSRYYNNHSWHGSKQLDGGVLFTQFSHFIDLLYWVFGDICNIQSRFYDFSHRHLTEFEDSGSVLFDFKQGGSGSICFSTAVANKNMESSISVIGEKGSLKISGQYMDRLTYYDVPGTEQPVLKPTNPPNNYGLYQGSAANHYQMICNATEVFSNISSPATTLQDGIKTVEIIEKMYSAAK